jgi:type I restriction enzyme S subunit
MESICAAIGGIVEQAQALQAEAQQNIALLQERRSALISAAVTGQIDVRGFSAGGGSEAA